MSNTTFSLILQGIDIRQNLSAIRQEIKTPEIKAQLRKELSSHIPELIALLSNEDAKTRKNAALFMGDMGNYDFLDALFQSYKSEEKLFVKSAYLTALSSFDCSEYLPELKERIQELSDTPLTIENTKHIQEELRSLSKLIILEEGMEPHTFTGYNHPLDCILLTNKLYKELIESEITDGEIVPFGAGVRIVTDNLADLLDIRTYSELLLVVPGLTTITNDPVHAAKALANSNLLMLLRSTHKEKTPFYFRIELKSKMALDIKSKFSKKLASELEHLTNRSLLNSTSNYEVELRLIENKLGTFNVLLKLLTIPDHRFSYRRESVAASIRPVNAAQLVALAKDYMIEDSRTLDPFCGVGTLLIERQKIVKGNTSYGIDFYAPAIDKARINTEAAGQIVHYINRNFFEFTHEYKFDEIFTNMPFATGHKSEDEIQVLYQDFFPKAKEVLTSTGTIIMYSHNAELVRELSIRYEFNIVESYEIMPREGTWLFIIKYQ